MKFDKSKIQIICLIIFTAGFFVAQGVRAAVVFEDNFDSQADWEPVNGSECSPVGSIAPYACNPDVYPDKWNAFRSVMGPGAGLSDVIRISHLPGNLPDHTGTGSGKADVVYNQAVSGANWPGDGILIKYFGSTSYNELYFRAWIRTQSNWQAVDGAQSKIFRIQYWDGITDPNMFQFFNNPNLHGTLFQLGAMGSVIPGAAAFIPGFRCDGTPSTCDSTNTGYIQNNAYEKMDTFTRFGTETGSPASVFANTNWHRYDIHIKMNTPGQYNGILEDSYDGVMVYQKTDAYFRATSTPSNVGLNVVGIGGNSKNEFSADGEQWYAIDDVVVSTSPIPADYVPGGVLDTTPPSTPANPSATLSGTQVNLTWTASTDNVSVSSYNIYRNSSLIGTSTTNSYTDSGLLSNTAYTYYVVAVDSSSNISANSTTTSITTPTFTTATLGITTSTSNVDDSNNSHLSCAQFTMPAGQSGAATAFSVYIGAPLNSSPNNSWSGAIYSDSSNSPGSFISSTASNTISTANPTTISTVTSYLNTAAISAPLSANTKYWLCYNTNALDSTHNQTMVAGTGLHHWMAQTFGTWPSTFVSAGSNTNQYAAYLTYNISGGTDTAAPAAPSGLSVR